MCDKINSLYDLWCQKATDSAIAEELASVKGDAAAIEDRFFQDLDFGTAGLRGVIGAGTNRMNVYTVGRATQGFADYINSAYKNGSVAIAYDSRNNSDLFSRTAACVFAANGIKVWLYPELAPTPMLSFAVRFYGCVGGVVVTASHNPAEYNGYKAYGDDGCQLGGEACAQIYSNIQNTDIFEGVNTVDFDTALSEGKIQYIGEDCYEEYYKNVLMQSVDSDLVGKSGLKVIYTPLHGTGNKPVREILKRIGVSDVTIVKEQELPDGNFPTAPYPNPEIRQPFECALALAQRLKPDLLLATDPYADRVGIAVPEGDDYRLVTGNEVGAMLLDYVLKRRSEKGTLPKNPVAVKSIVSTSICDKIAAKYGCEMRNVLTGFKYIGEQIALLEKDNEPQRYILGFEESYGYLAGTYVRDKDAVVASMLICEMAAYYRTVGLSLVDVITAVYNEYGRYLHRTSSFTFKGASGMEQMANIMKALHTEKREQIAGYKVVAVADYLNSTRTDCDGKVATLTLPKADVIAFELEDNNCIIVRPSGTEPKIKVYVTSVAKDTAEAEKINATLTAEAAKMLDQ
ncbi:MAG: phospho-sugar mutase [Clostridia bacterium]|nr:phospho-sugar mutase [Clostridia bacterium]